MMQPTIKKFISNRQKGVMLVYVIIIIAVFSILMIPVLNIVSGKMKLLRSAADREQALQIAEAGTNYYQWHLAHFPTDYQDGTNGPGPYVHDFTDFDTQNKIGKFSLVITPPVVGSAVVTIQSSGWTNANPTVIRTITAKYGIPSLAKYAFLSNDIIWIGSDETVNGQLQSNNGVRFDGGGNAPIQSAKSTYTCGASQGCSSGGQTKNGVWGSASQGVQNFWQFPVPAVDFSALTSNLSSMKSTAQAEANGSNFYYLPPSNKQGYSLVFNNTGTVSIYKVNSLTSNPTGWDTTGTAHNESTDYNSNCIGTGSCGRTLQITESLPANGIIYVEDKTWVEGTVTGRVTVAAAVLPYNASTAPTIYIPNNITYAAKDGSSVLGLIAQKDIVVTYHAPNNLEIDAALISQNGGAQFFYYPNVLKNTITIYGAIMTFAQWTWTWVNGSDVVVSGYPITIDNYDSNLLYGPPPNFPLSASSYQLLSWLSN
jgi:hypothetical protein